MVDRSLKDRTISPSPSAPIISASRYSGTLVCWPFRPPAVQTSQQLKFRPQHHIHSPSEQTSSRVRKTRHTQGHMHTVRDIRETFQVSVQNSERGLVLDLHTTPFDSIQSDPIKTYQPKPITQPTLLQTVPFCAAAAGAGATGALLSANSENRPPTTGLSLKVMPG